MRTGSRVNLVVFTGQRFGGAVVTDPEIRLGQTETKPWGYRYARMRCDCGTAYVAQLSHLYAGRSRSCPGCATREHGRKRRKTGGHVYKANRGWCVVVYVGHYKSRAEAEGVARRARAVLVPDVKDRPAMTTL
jgi:hypothetical protein